MSETFPEFSSPSSQDGQSEAALPATDQSRTVVFGNGPWPNWDDIWQQRMAMRLQGSDGSAVAPRETEPTAVSNQYEASRRKDGVWAAMSNQWVEEKRPDKQNESATPPEPTE